MVSKIQTLIFHSVEDQDTKRFKFWWGQAKWKADSGCVLRRQKWTDEISNLVWLHSLRHEKCHGNLGHRDRLVVNADKEQSGGGQACGWVYKQWKPQDEGPNVLQNRLLPGAAFPGSNNRKPGLNMGDPLCGQVKFPGNSTYTSLYRRIHSTQS